jgi:hypothetical protein
MHIRQAIDLVIESHSERYEGVSVVTDVSCHGDAVRGYAVQVWATSADGSRFVSGAVVVAARPFIEAVEWAESHKEWRHMVREYLGTERADEILSIAEYNHGCWSRRKRESARVA